MSVLVELFIGGLMSGLVVGLAALAITLVFGIARFPNAATGDAMTLGAFVALSVSAITGSVIIGGLIAAVMGVAVGVGAYVLVFRKLAGRSSVANLLASMGIAFFVRAVVGLIFGHQQQVFQLPLVRPWRVFDIRIQPSDLTLATVALVTLGAVFLVLHMTPVGRRMRAVADDPGLARVSGISPTRVMIALWAMTGSVSAIAGVMYGIKTVVTPEMGWDMLLPAFAAAILGGIGHPVGAIVAGVLLGALQEMSTPLVGFTYKIAISFVVLLIVLLVRPQGLLGQAEGAR
ncbi:branched-chain amino acid ABC transporter permease [Mesorhizobium sp. VK23B]|uniref:Branched-chain amino acid ABC transporter permease n=1 Tax=Mesorhizobium dulcispinae TaxID=3072316 RepID=A0ABU4XMU3_9HYPH|nr:MULTISPECIES: branched-chain amino acid ABC transporter permease [unclassified Mesorhizobium]MDX8469731.1 branched-chain amino acid ABC transporter permease [Mesorhizobium sp. VK23B]MDX8476070.1 branched-chain amino acid ABC transporter permease [Mesorhizobium sp. VK23A]